jgi:pseudouridine kinase
MYFIDKGVKRIFITLGEDGVYYREGDYANHFKSNRIDIVNATGAGDAFMAGVVYCSLEGKEIDYTAKFSSAMSELALKSYQTVSQVVSVENVKRVVSGYDESYATV